MDNKFLELVSSPLMNLDHTYRYSGTKLVEAESLSQHIIDTIMMGLKIIDKVNGRVGHEFLDPKVYVLKAIYHDLEEVITGDIPRPLKYYNEHTCESLKDVADKVAVEFFDDQFEDGHDHYVLWRDAKLGPEGRILKLVDTLVVASKVIKEVTLLHNGYMLRVAYEVSRYLRELKQANLFSEDDDADCYLRCLIDDALNSMQDIINENNKCMHDLNIYKQSMI